jgi:hypothetical protein
MGSRLAHLDGNAAAGELAKVFAIDVTAAQGRCANCGSTRRFAEAHVYMDGRGIVARCAACEHVLLRLVSARERVFLDASGMTFLRFDTTEQDGASMGNRANNR